MARARKKAKIGKILEEFRGLQDITNINNNMKKSKISNMKSKDGSIMTGRQDIDDVFAKFYEDLYRRRHAESSSNITAEDVKVVGAVTTEEVEE